jgi:hypothetical protein
MLQGIGCFHFLVSFSVAWFIFFAIRCSLVCTFFSDLWQIFVTRLQPCADRVLSQHFMSRLCSGFRPFSTLLLLLLLLRVREEIELPCCSFSSKKCARGLLIARRARLDSWNFWK